MGERIIDLSTAPVVGRLYLVPTIRAALWQDGALADWPVLLPGHTDAQFFPHFPWSHHHVDPALRPGSLVAGAGLAGEGGIGRCAAEKALQRWPVSLRDRLGPPAPVIWRLRKCQRSVLAYQHHDKEPPQKLKAHFGGEQCVRNRTGWVCPHQRFPLGSVAPVEGVLTCPMHGLRIDAETGRVLAAQDVAIAARAAA
jgi:hypothetical protein